MADLMDDPVWRGPFTFVQAADTQLGFAADESWGGADGDDWSEEVGLLRRLVACCNALKPRPAFVCVCGDLVHALPENALEDAPAVRRYANDRRRRRQGADFKRITADLAIPLVCVCGNHDVGDRPTPASLKAYRDDYGADFRAFWCGGVRCLVLNSQLLSDPSGAAEESAAQDAWLDAELAVLEATPAKHAVAFQHIPWFLSSEKEERRGYFDLPDRVRGRWLPRLAAAGVSHVFCGHYHRNAGAFTDDGRTEIVVTSAVGRQMSESEVATNAADGTASDTKSGLRLVTVGDAAITHAYRDFDDLERDLGIY